MDIGKVAGAALRSHLLQLERELCKGDDDRDLDAVVYALINDPQIRKVLHATRNIAMLDRPLAEGPRYLALQDRALVQISRAGGSTFWNANVSQEHETGPTGLVDEWADELDGAGFIELTGQGHVRLTEYGRDHARHAASLLSV